jgi:hypothetical protein
MKPDKNHDEKKPSLMDHFLAKLSNPDNAPVSAAEKPGQKTDTSTRDTVDRTSTALEKPDNKPSLMDHFRAKLSNPDNAPVSAAEKPGQKPRSTADLSGLPPELALTRASVYYPPPETPARALLPKQATLFKPLTFAERAKVASRSAPPRPASGGSLPTGRKHSSMPDRGPDILHVIHVRADRWKQLGLFPRECGGRGDCMYYALLQQLILLNLVLPTFKVWDLRQAAAGYLQANSERMQGFVTCKQGADMLHAWQQFCNSVRTMGVWGDEPTLVAVGQIYKVDIQVWSMTDPRLDRFVPYVDGQITDDRVSVGHYQDAHYVAMTPP